MTSSKKRPSTVTVLRTLLKSKIHRARVTRSDLTYEGSISVDSSLMKAADFLPHEMVHVWNVTNGNRFETYVIPAPAGSGQIQINGAAAHLADPDDLVIIASFTSMDTEAAQRHKPTVVFVDERNQIIERTTKSGRSLKVASM